MTINRLNILVAHGAEMPWASSLAGSLAEWPVELIWSPCVENALELARKQAIHVGIVDDSVPTEGGLGLVRRMRRMGQETPCVLVTTDPNQRFLQDALTLQVFAVILARTYQETLIPALSRLVRDRYKLNVPGIGDNN